MIPTVMDKRPPFVRFEEREHGIDAEKSEELGHPVPKVVIFACITPHGSKDVVEKIAEEWLAQIKKQAAHGQYSLEWANHFNLQFEEWKKGNELPRTGTPIKTWAMLATSEPRRRLIALGLTTVEDLAAVPDTNLAMIGLDGRYLRDLARGWVDEAADKGVNAQKIANLAVENDDLKATVKSQGATIRSMQKRLEALEDGDAKTPRKQRQSAAGAEA